MRRRLIIRQNLFYIFKAILDFTSDFKGCLLYTSNADFKWEPKYEEIKETVASVRLDSLLSLAFSSSRSKLTALIEAGRVYVNGKLITSNGYHVKDNDIISVRQMGRFQYEGVLSETKKGRYYVTIDVYKRQVVCDRYNRPADRRSY